ncbi:MAG: CAP domain-containing protein [Bacteroidia bacterium]
MRLQNILIALYFALSSFNSFSQVLSDEEKNLYTLIMEYRKEKGLPSIPLSASLTYVAQTHARDLVDNKPDVGNCNAHSWSSNGNWTACCYTPDHAQAELMWSKPRELTAYQGDGFEIACGSNDCCSDFEMTADYALQSWKKSSGHNAVIINQGIWNDQWNAIGIGLYKGFAVVWFGNEFDNE